VDEIRISRFSRAALECSKVAYVSLSLGEEHGTAKEKETHIPLLGELEVSMANYGAKGC
jgi:hypothetical protein